MLIRITEAEQQKLKSIAYDEMTVEALKKFFLQSFLEEKYVPSDTALLAAEKLAIEALERIFEKLNKMKSSEYEETPRKNVV